MEIISPDNATVQTNYSEFQRELEGGICYGQIERQCLLSVINSRGMPSNAFEHQQQLWQLICKYKGITDEVPNVPRGRTINGRIMDSEFVVSWTNMWKILKHVSYGGIHVDHFTRHRICMYISEMKKIRNFYTYF